MRLRMRATAIALVLGVGCLLVGAEGVEAAVKKVSMVDRLLAPQGTAVVNLAKGTVSVKATLDPLPATIDTGSGTFQATIYKAYLESSTDAAMEIPLGSVYPTAKKKASIAASLKGDLSSTDFGFDRVVIVAYSKDGLSSFDVLTGSLQ
jgi:hypothetical protein